MSVQSRTAPAPSAAEVITKAVLRAADRLGLPNKVLATVLGLSEATISRLRNGPYLLQRGPQPFELAALLLPLYRSADAIVWTGRAVSVRQPVVEERTVYVRGQFGGC